MAQQRARTQVRGGRDVVLTAAIDHFQRLGYHGTSMRDIARGANITVASIYHHFPSKQVILQDIMARVLSDVISMTRSALMSAGSSPSEQLSAVMKAWILFHTTRRAEALIGASEIRSLDAQGHRLVVALRDEQERMFRDVIERGVAEGEFDTPYPREASRAIINMGYSVASWYRTGGELSPEQLAERYAVLALGTVAAPVDKSS
ncbi:TetR/AcrR family transcriptional regulator [Aeromicrobium sp. CTD01-1L150]|uniref:TetR/AcrR family transcriptional regulator n=1 Tax=Aeromicrobium sp. CTD01-1L150 TaxID=3341830 RepID=UPI0035C01598